MLLTAVPQVIDCMHWSLTQSQIQCQHQKMQDRLVTSINIEQRKHLTLHLGATGGRLLKGTRPPGLPSELPVGYCQVAWLVILIIYDNDCFCCCLDYGVSSYFAAVMPRDVNCVSKWERHDNTTVYENIEYPRAYTLSQCKEACEIDHRCVAVDFDGTICTINLHPNHKHANSSAITHYDLVSRCNIMPGQFSTKNAFFFDSVALLRWYRNVEQSIGLVTPK